MDTAEPYLERKLLELRKFLCTNYRGMRLGQWQSGQVLNNHTEKVVIDWSEGLCHTFPLRSIWSRVHWLEREGNELFSKFLDAMLTGYFGTDNYNREDVFQELNLWRALKAVNASTHLELVHDKKNFFSKKKALYSRDFYYQDDLKT